MFSTKSFSEMHEGKKFYIRDHVQVHARTAERVGEELREDPLPRHLHAGGTRHADRPHRVQGPGKS